MHIVDVVPGSPAWHAWRRTGLGGSDAPALLGLSRHRTPARLLREKRGEPLPPIDDTLALARGRVLEPLARDRYRALFGVSLQPICCMHETERFLLASLDGWSEAERLPVEIKAPRRAEHREALAGRVPRSFLCQCVHVLLVTGAPLAHFVSLQPDGFAPRDQLAVVAVRADPRLVDELLLAERSFWRAVETGEPPPRPPRIDWSRARTEKVRAPFQTAGVSGRTSASAPSPPASPAPRRPRS